jgi:hypothetical protein
MIAIEELLYCTMDNTSYSSVVKPTCSRQLRKMMRN